MTTHEDLFKYVPSEEQEMAGTYITLVGKGKSREEWLEYIDSMSPTNIDDRAMLEAISKQADDLEVRKEANRKLYYSR